MNWRLDVRLGRYVSRFAVVHFVTITAVGSAFLLIQDALPATERVTLEAFAPYRPIGALDSSGQLLRGVILALILSPFSDTIVRGRRGWLVPLAARGAGRDPRLALPVVGAWRGTRERVPCWARCDRKAGETARHSSAVAVPPRTDRTNQTRALWR